MVERDISLSNIDILSEISLLSNEQKREIWSIIENYMKSVKNK